jgi:predicted phage baseplate assembly protein
VFGPLTAGDISGATGDGLPVTQVDAVISNEIVGSSDGTPGQTFALARTPLIDGSLEVIVNEGTSSVWTEVVSLLNSQPTDTSYVVRRDENDVAWIQFGDFTYGRPPRRGRNNITANYNIGGGAKGNVPAGAISKIVQPVAQLKRVLNVGAATGGADAETNADAVLRGPQQFRSMGRAVTAADYVQHAKTFGVAKVQAKASSWNVVQLFVAPAGGGYPSLTLQKDLIAYFDNKRMLTTQVQVKDPMYIDITIVGELTVLPQYFNDQVQNNAVQAGQQLWSFDNVDFGATLFLSKIYEVIEELDGVESVFITTFNRQDGLATALIAAGGAIRLGNHELPNLSISLTPVNGLTNG